MRSIKLPLTNEIIQSLKAGEHVYLSGKLYTARDAAHVRLLEDLKNASPPIDIRNEVIYYVGPTPTREGEIIGSAGPTTSGRMDDMTPELLKNGLKGMIGKGKRNVKVIESIVKNNSVYFVAIGGSAALIAKSVKACTVVAYHDLGTEAIRELVVENMPVIVAVDCYGNDYYEIGPRDYLGGNHGTE